MSNENEMEYKFIFYLFLSSFCLHLLPGIFNIILLNTYNADTHIVLKHTILT